MALSESELSDVSRRLKSLRAELARRRGVREVSQYAVASEVGKAPRTFQSHENGEVEPRDNSYGRYAAFYSEQLGREITKNWVMFGSDDGAPPQPAASTPDLLDALSGDGIGQLTAELDNLRDGLLALVDGMLDQAEREAEAAERRADRGEPSASPHGPERARRYEAARRWAMRQPRTPDGG